MSFEMDPQRATEPESYEQLIVITGAGAGTPTKTVGRGVVVTWVSTGLYTITFTDPPGNLIGFGVDFQATTMSALKGYSGTLGAIDATGKIVQISITNSSFTLADLQVLQTAHISLTFVRRQLTI